MAARFAYGKGPGGNDCLSIGLTALPCPGVALRLNTVIDCTQGKDRMPPITIDFLKNLPPPPQQSETPAPASAVAAVQVMTGRFTCNCGDFVLFSQLERVEKMVAAAGLPRECAPSVNDFFHLSASQGANSFYKAIAITVEAGAPESIVVVDEDEEVPPGAVVGECAICYKEYLVGGDTSTKLACGHAFHRSKCLDRWTAVNRTCPYWDDDDCDDSESEYGYDVPGEEDDGSSPVPDGSM